MVSPVKVADDATVASATSALSPMTTASQFPSDLLSLRPEIGQLEKLQDRFIRPGSRFAVDDRSTVSAFTTFPEDSIYLNKPPAQLPDDDKSEYQLTHWQVPQHGDYSRPYCTACHFTDCERCTYCFSHKLTRTPRMHMERLGEALLHMNPDMMGKDAPHLAAVREGR